MSDSDIQFKPSPIPNEIKHSKKIPKNAPVKDYPPHKSTNKLPMWVVLFLFLNVIMVHVVIISLGLAWLKLDTTVTVVYVAATLGTTVGTVVSFVKQALSGYLSKGE